MPPYNDLGFLDLEEDRDRWRKRATILADELERLCASTATPPHVRARCVRALLDAGHPAPSHGPTEMVPYA